MRMRMESPLGWIGFSVALCWFVWVPPAPGQAPEIRGMWVSRFEWPNADPATCQTTINRIMSDLKGANFNAVFCQIRGQADVLYPSPYEVWSPLIGGVDPGWDPLAYAIAAAHAQGLEFHAYINTHTCWQSSAHAPPANPDHLFYDHCNAADASALDWLIHDSAGNPVQWHENDYVWIAPGVPAYQAYMRKQVMYVVENYDVDGVHFDRIRTPNSLFSYDPISMARFSNMQTNPGGLTFHPWTANQITRMVCDIYAAVMAVKPHVQVSAAVFPDPATAPTNQHQAALAWAQAGALDIIVPMMYSTGGAGSTWDLRLQAWLNGSAGRHVVAGQITSEGITWLLEQIALTRTRGAEGNSVFSWSSFTWWTDYLNQVYQVPVTQPAMPWKDSPTFGIIQGYVTNAAGTQVVDAQIVRTGSTYVGLSSGDGYYSFLLVPPGTYTLSASHPDYGAVAAPGVAIAAGQVVRRDIAFSTVVAPVIAEVTPDPQSATVGQPYAIQLTLTQGTATSWEMLVGPPGATVNSSTGRVSGWTPSSGNAGQSLTFTVRASNSVGFDDESWSVLVAGGTACTLYPLTGFDGYANGTRILFNLPRYSGSTRDDLALTPDVAQITDAVTAFSPPGSLLVQWQYVDIDPQRWLRLTTYNGNVIPNPTVVLDRPIRVRLRVDAGRFRLAVGIRETGTTAEVGQNGGTAGTIEWIGAATDLNGAPQGILVEPMPGVWQTFVFDPLTDPIRTMNGDGVLSSPSGKGVFEHLAFSVVDTVGPFTVYIDDVDFLCAMPGYGDLDNDGDVDLSDYTLFAQCLQGPNVTVVGACLNADADDDQDVDAADFAAFQEAIGG